MFFDGNSCKKTFHSWIFLRVKSKVFWIKLNSCRWTQIILNVCVCVCGSHYPANSEKDFWCDVRVFVLRKTVMFFFFLKSFNVLNSEWKYDIEIKCDVCACVRYNIIDLALIKPDSSLWYSLRPPDLQMQMLLSAEFSSLREEPHLHFFEIPIFYFLLLKVWYDIFPQMLNL